MKSQTQKQIAKNFVAIQLVRFAVWMLRRLTNDAKLSHYEIYSDPRYGKT